MILWWILRTHKTLFKSFFFSVREAFKTKGNERVDEKTARIKNPEEIKSKLNDNYSLSALYFRWFFLSIHRRTNRRYELQFYGVFIDSLRFPFVFFSCLPSLFLFRNYFCFKVKIIFSALLVFKIESQVLGTEGKKHSYIWIKKSTRINKIKRLP